MSIQTKKSLTRTAGGAPGTGGDLRTTNLADSNSDLQSDLLPNAQNTCSNTTTLDKVDATDPLKTTYLRKAQDVVTQSNALTDEGKDPMWQGVNGDYGGVSWTGNKNDKPEEWFNGLTLDADGNVSPVRGTDTFGIDDLGEFRQMIQDDLDFNGNFEKFASADEWIDALLRQYCKDLPADDPQVKKVRGIGENLWSYAKTGADVTGRTDVAQFQGLIYSLDSLLAEASGTNTPHGGTFTIPGTDIELDTLGDGKYGRATVLEARLLAAVVEKPEKEKETDPEADSFLILDASASMRDKYQHLADLMDEVDFGNTTVGAMTGWGTDVQWNTEVLDPEALKQELHDLSDPNKNPDEVEPALKGMMGAAASESSIRKAIETLQNDPRFAVPTPDGKKRQIVVATDEYDWKPGEIGTLKKEALAKQVEVKVIFMMDDGQYVVDLTKVDDKLIQSIESDAKNKVEGQYLTTKMPLTDSEHAKDTQDGSKNTHLRLNWEAIAQAQGSQKEAYAK